MQAESRRRSAPEVAGWIYVWISVFGLLASGVLRLTGVSSGEDELFDARYLVHPAITALHILPGMVYVALAPLQFVRRVRNGHLQFHRMSGRLLAVCAAATGFQGIAAAWVFPAFGGIATQAASFFFGTIFLFCLGKALWHIRHKRVPSHREWMIRTFALALGVASIRYWGLLLEPLSGLSFGGVFGTSFWLGFSTNLVAAEYWINRTRRPRAKAGA